jgi:hypothetical protein
MKKNLLIKKTSSHFIVEFDEKNKFAGVELIEDIPGFEVERLSSGAYKVPIRYKAILITWANNNFEVAEIVETINGEDIIKDFLTDKPKAKQCGLELKFT